MPIYEYRCQRCGDFDVMQKITEKPLRKCPTCKSKVTKLMSNTAFQLRGTGWYVTDYANKGKSSSSESSGSESKDTSPGSAASTSSPSDEKPSKPKAKGKRESAAA
ncbi:MAG: zinc ribbon domain-containing protein [Deltaproteobacteria bacterium]|nr:zinc ribbon domain-containing protein [Deltaproteobacteria bacterium]